MKKVTAFVGSARKKNTYKAVEQFLANLEALGDVEYEIVRLNDYTLKHCRGCMLCFDKGEERCPLKDDRDLLMQKMMDADGVVFATPNYTFGMSGVMKMTRPARSAGSIVATRPLGWPAGAGSAIQSNPLDRHQRSLARRRWESFEYRM